MIAQKMDSLARTVTRISSVPAPARTFPMIAISPESRDLSSLSNWLALWDSCYEDWKDNYKSTTALARIRTKEQALERLIKSPSARNNYTYARHLSDWAFNAGNFPSFAIQNPFTGRPISCADYWKLIIIRAAGKDSLHTIPTKDIQELLEHCEEHIENGGIFAHALFEFLKEAIKKQTDYFGYGAPYLLSGGPAFLETSSEEFTISQLNAGLEDTAPMEKPLPENYPSKFAYIKAKFKWDRAVKEGFRSST
jgi:hypothetical protein